MRQLIFRATFAALLASAALQTASAQRVQPTTPLPADSVGPGVPAFWVRPGYRVTLAADKVPNARFLEIDDKGTLYVSRPGPGDILVLRDKNGDGVYETRETFTSGKPGVQGLCFADGWLWYTQNGAVGKARDTNGDNKADDEQVVIPGSQPPAGGADGGRPILVTPAALYMGIGGEREKLFRFAKNGTGGTPFVSGIRRTEKLRLRPGTAEVWGVDHGITDTNPDGEFNQYTESSVTGANVPPPEWQMGARGMPQGFTFLRRPYFSDDHQGDAFIACHGSGCRVERVLFDKISGKPYGSLMVIGTLAADGRVLGRPVDCVEAEDGSVLVSDDQTGQIYRIQRSSEPVGKSPLNIIFGQSAADKKNPKKRGAHESKGR